MSNYQVASRYAKSLIDLSVEQNKLEDINADMQYLQKALDSRDLLLLFKSPIIQAGKKTAIVQEVFKGKISDMTLGFLKIITKKGREKFLPEIVKSYLDQYKKHKNITDVKLTTASPISVDVKTSLEKALLDSNVTANSVEVETLVDEDILGGFVIEVGDKLYDASVRHKLNKIKKEFTENKYIKSF